MKKLILMGLLVVSNQGLAANCELKNNSDSASCYENQSYAEVQKIYNKLLSSTKADKTYGKFATQPLIESQKAWLKYRDSYCDSYSSYHGELNNHANCIVELNKARAIQLHSDFEAAF